MIWVGRQFGPFILGLYIVGPPAVPLIFATGALGPHTFSSRGFPSFIFIVGHKESLLFLGFYYVFDNLMVGYQYYTFMTSNKKA